MTLLLAKPTPHNVDNDNDRFSMFNKKRDIAARHPHPNASRQITRSITGSGLARPAAITTNNVPSEHPCEPDTGGCFRYKSRKASWFLEPSHRPSRRFRLRCRSPQQKIGVHRNIAHARLIKTIQFPFGHGRSKPELVGNSARRKTLLVLRYRQTKKPPAPLIR